MTEQLDERMLTKEQKVGFFFLLCFSVLVVVLGFFQIRNTIYDPFVVRVNPEDSALSKLSAASEEQKKLAALDTDLDGLSDADELRYATSRYIPDTDSDGKTDAEEVAAGTDPLCPEGTVCTNDIAELPQNTTQDFSSPLLSEDPGLLGSVQAGQGTVSFDSIAALVDHPDQIRALLLQTGGVTSEQLAQLDDAALIEMLQTVLKQKGVVPESSTSTTTTP